MEKEEIGPLLIHLMTGLGRLAGGQSLFAGGKGRNGLGH